MDTLWSEGRVTLPYHGPWLVIIKGHKVGPIAKQRKNRKTIKKIIKHVSGNPRLAMGKGGEKRLVAAERRKAPFVYGGVLKEDHIRRVW